MVLPLVLGLFLDWTTVGSASGDSPFDYFFTGGIAWLLIVAVGVLALMNAMGKLPPAQPWALILLGLAAIATLLMVLRIILGGRDLGFGIEGDRGIGMWGALIWSGIALAGAVMGYQAGGGDLKDLTDVDKLKSSFGGDDSPPPPPPPPAP